MTSQHARLLSGIGLLLGIALGTSQPAMAMLRR